ncbi:MAG: hypothetical protein CO079_03445 [Nitrosopumilales archaeon CG_4_9_14_0_8_um_filter_34_10]|nr:MAG: hypothetical protein CO079_03445 [Nitrosopumilales archaeon CG_4_9_14_0_8_um_filter_34_10]
MIVICQGQNISFNGDADAIRSKLFEIRIQQTKDTAENLKVDTLPSRHLHSAPSEISQQP